MAISRIDPRRHLSAPAINLVAGFIEIATSLLGGVALSMRAAAAHLASTNASTTVANVQLAFAAPPDRTICEFTNIVYGSNVRVMWADQ